MEIKKFHEFNENEHSIQNYMFFQNLKQMKEQIEKILNMNNIEVDNILKEHNWALDHIATSKDDIEEVYNFLNNDFGGVEDVNVEEIKENYSKVEISDYLKSNCRSWEQDCDNEEDTITLTDHLKNVFTNVSYNELYQISKHWTGYDETEDIQENQNVEKVKDGIVYRGEKFPGYNKPKRYTGNGKYKFRVLAKDGDEIKIVNFGHRDYEDFTQHKDTERRKSFRARHKCDPVKNLKKTSAKYWACQYLW